MIHQIEDGTRERGLPNLDELERLRRGLPAGEAAPRKIGSP
jgi:hypothetical protein